MKQYIDKAALVAEINRLQEATMDKNQNFLSSYHEGIFDGLSMLENFLDTLEVKEIHEDIDMDLNHLFEEMGVEPDSRIALMFKNAFYKSVDNYLDKKEDKL